MVKPFRFTGSFNIDKGNSKLRTYKLFEANLHREKYLKCINIRAHRMTLAKFGMSAQKLRIETGRYQGLEESDRIFLLCKSGVGPVINYMYVCIYVWM